MSVRSPDVVPMQDVRALVRLATLAPSGHNTQPWKFRVHDHTVRIYPDFSRRLPVVDPDDHALYISLGCAVENLAIASRYHGLHATIECFPANEEQECLVVHLSHGAPDIEPALMQTIPARQSTRRMYDGQPIPTSDLQKLEAASQQPGVQFRLFTEARDIEPIIEFVKEGNRQQFSDPAFVAELLSWIRFSKREVAVHSDGLTAAVMGLPPVPRWLGTTIMKTMTGPQREAERAAELVRSSSALMLFVAEQHDKRHWVEVGRSFERVALTATALNIKHAHVNMPCEVMEVRQQFQRYLSLAMAQPLLLLRIGYAKSMPRSPRRPLEAVVL